MKKNLLALGALALLFVMAVPSNATNIIPLKPDSANAAPCTVFGASTPGMSCGKTTAPAGMMDIVGYLNVTGTITSGNTVAGTNQVNLPNGITLGTSPNISTVTSAGVLQLATVLQALYGGTGADLHAAAVGALPYFTSTGVMAALAAGTQNYLLQANGAGAPSFTNAPTAAGTNITAIPAANILAGSFGSGNFTVTGLIAATAAILTPTTPAHDLACTAGSIWSDATYLYRCMSTGVVYRSQMSWTTY